MSNQESPDSGKESIPPPPASDPVAVSGTGPSIPPPPPAMTRSPNTGSAVGGGCLTSVGAVAILLSLVLFSAAGDARADSSDFMSGFGDFLSGVAQLFLFGGVVVLIIGVIILNRLRR